MAFPGLRGVLPGFGLQEPQRLGPGLRDPRRQGAALDRRAELAARRSGTSGGAGRSCGSTRDAGVALACLTDRPFGAWAGRGVAGAVGRRAGRRGGPRGGLIAPELVPADPAGAPVNRSTGPAVPGPAAEVIPLTGGFTAGDAVDMICHVISEAPQTLDRAREVLRRAHAVTPSRSLLRLEDTLRRGDATTRQLAQLIEGSPALAARVLRMANSSFYAPLEPVVGLSRAVPMLGHTVLRQLVLATLVLSRQETGRSTRQGVAAARLTGNAVRCAVVARARLPRRRGWPRPTTRSPPACSTTSGTSTSSTTRATPTPPTSSTRRPVDSLAREIELTGTTHQLVGVAFAYDWNLPPTLAVGPVRAPRRRSRGRCPRSSPPATCWSPRSTTRPRTARRRRWPPATPPSRRSGWSARPGTAIEPQRPLRLRGAAHGLRALRLTIAADHGGAPAPRPRRPGPRPGRLDSPGRRAAVPEPSAARGRVAPRGRAARPSAPSSGVRIGVRAPPRRRGRGPRPGVRGSGRARGSAVAHPIADACRGRPTDVQASIALTPGGRAASPTGTRMRTTRGTGAGRACGRPLDPARPRAAEALRDERATARRRRVASQRARAEQHDQHDRAARRPAAAAGPARAAPEAGLPRRPPCPSPARARRLAAARAGAVPGAGPGRRPVPALAVSPPLGDERRRLGHRGEPAALGEGDLGGRRGVGHRDVDRDDARLRGGVDEGALVAGREARSRPP